MPVHKRRQIRLPAFAEDTGSYEIFSMRFGVYSHEERCNLAVREITDPTLYENGIPKDNGACSGFLGSTSPAIFCKTCGCRGGVSGACQGHYGIIIFPQSVYHTCWLPLTIKFLNMFCFFCSTPVFDCAGANFRTAKRAIQQVCKQPRYRRCARHHANGARDPTCPTCRNPPVCCPNCLAPVATYEKVQNRIETKWPPNARFETPAEEEFAKKRFTAERALQIFNDVSQDFLTGTLRLENHPKNMCILRSMLVPPNCVRPSVRCRTTKAKGEEDLTRSIHDLIRASITLRQKPTTANMDKLQTAIDIHHDKEVTSKNRMTRAVGHMKPKRSLTDRLGGKGGRLRRTIFGKRLNNCSRCVIGADATIDIWQLRCPAHIAMNQTRAATVNNRNRALLEQCVRIGMSAPGGAHFIVFPDGTRANLKRTDEAAVERILKRMVNGSVVHRMLRCVVVGWWVGVVSKKNTRC
jgi:DNA-directed RNA polymerase beta' subunit